MDTVPTPPLYAGFWRRFNAYSIDATIVLILAWMVDYAIVSNPAFAQSPDDFRAVADAVRAMQTGQITPELMATAKSSLFDSMFGGSIIGVNQFLMAATSAFYNIFFVIGDWQATPGKHWLGMKVVHADGSRLTLLQSALRHAASGISMLPLGLGCITIFYSKEKLAPHDMLCHTRVILRTRD